MKIQRKTLYMNFIAVRQENNIYVSTKKKSQKHAKIIIL